MRPDVIYKFKSKATADLLMLGPQGDELMRLLGREAPCPRGILETAQMADALARLHAAIAEQEAVAAAQGAGHDDPAALEAADAGAGTGTGTRHALPLRTRLWPMIQAIERAHAAGEPIVWGV
jgi:hypothetical protein